MARGGNTKEVAKLSIDLEFNTNNFNRDISNINKSIKNTEREFKSAGKGVNNFEKTFVGLDSKIKKTSKQIELYNVKLSKQKEAYDKLKSTLDNQVTKLNELESTLGKGSDEWQKQAELVAKNSAKLNKLSTDINETENTLSQLGNELYDSVNAFQQLGNESQTIEQKLAKVNRSASLTESEFDKLGAELQTSGTYFEKIGHEIEKVSSKIEHNKQKVDIYESEINKLGTTLDKNRQDHQQLAQEINKTETELSQAKSEYGENSSEAQQLNAKLLVLKDGYKNLGNEIDKGENDLNTYQTELNQTQKEIVELSREMKNIPFDKIGNDLKNAGQNIKSVGQNLTSNVTVPIVGAGTAVGAMSYSFEQGLAKVGSLVGKSGSEMREYEEDIKNLSKSVGVGTSEMNEAWYQAISAGVKLGDSLGFLETSAKLAVGGFTSTESAVSLLTTTMNIYGDKAGSVTQISDKLLTVQNKGVTTVNDLASSMGQSLSIGGSYGVTFDNVAAAFAKVTAQGRTTSEASTQITRVLEELGDSGSKVGKIIKEQTGKSFTDLMKEGVSLKDALGYVKASADNSGLALDQLFSSSEAGQGAIALLSEGGLDFNEVLKDLESSTGATDKAFQGMKESAGAQLLDAINSLKISLLDMGDALGPVIAWLAEKIQELADWFSSLDEDGQKTVITMLGLAAAVGPVLSAVGTLLTIGGNMTLMFGKAGSSAGIFKSALALMSGPVGIGLAIGAFVALAAIVGDNSSMLLGLQDKFGSFGVIIGGICEFISGIWTATFEQLFNVAQLGMDVIAALIDGPGGATVSDAWKRYNEKTTMLQEEAADKLTLTTTRGLSQMRNATDEQLNGCITLMDGLLGQVPAIADGHYLSAATNISQQLSNMDSTQIASLQSMNDTTRMMFQGIKEGMDVKDATNQVVTNLELMKSNGKLKVDTLQKDVQGAMGTLKNNVDSKTKETANVVGTNMDDAKSKAKTNADNIAKEVGQAFDKTAQNAKQGSSKVATNTDGDFKKANKSVQQSATDMYNGSKKSYSKMADTARTEGTRMYRGVTTSAEQMSRNAKSAASDMYRGVTNSTSKMADRAISDWNRIRNAYSRSIQGTVTTVKKSVTKAAPAPKGRNLDIPQTRDFKLPRVDLFQFNGGYYTSSTAKSREIYNKPNAKENLTVVLLEKLITLMTDKDTNPPQPIHVYVGGEEVTSTVSRGIARNMKKRW